MKTYSAPTRAPSRSAASVAAIIAADALAAKHAAVPVSLPPDHLLELLDAGAEAVSMGLVAYAAFWEALGRENRNVLGRNWHQNSKATAAKVKVAA